MPRLQHILTIFLSHRPLIWNILLGFTTFLSPAMKGILNTEDYKLKPYKQIWSQIYYVLLVSESEFIIVIQKTRQESMKINKSVSNKNFSSFIQKYFINAGFYFIVNSVFFYHSFLWYEIAIYFLDTHRQKIGSYINMKTITLLIFRGC